MMGMDCINQQAVSDRDCSHCIWHTDGRCASWDCEYISRKEALEALEKVKAMSTHPNSPNTLKALDCISRQDAVDIIIGYAEQFNGYIGTPNDSEVYAYARGLLLGIERNINALPSAQPEIEERMSETEQNVPNDDFISRKRAIDAIEAVFPVDPMKSEYAQGIACGAALSKTYIEQMPSAQPEIIHCRDCKHRGEKPIADGRYWCEIHDTFMYYCSDAERRTDEWMGNS